MTTPIASSFAASYAFLISLAALTNNFSAYLYVDIYLLWRDQITLFLSAMIFMAILMALIRLLLRPFLLMSLLLQIPTTLKNMHVGLKLINLLYVALRICFCQPLTQWS
jgi:hypothetical protein